MPWTRQTAPESPDSGAGRIARPLLAGMLALAVAMGVGRFAFTPILPSMRAAGLSTAELGTLASANYLGYLVGALLAAVVRRGRAADLLLRVGLAVVVAATGLMAAASTMPAWLALRFVAGVASAGVFVLASTALLGLLRRRGRPGLAGWFYGGVGIGIAASGLAVVAAGGLADLPGAPWQREWLAVAALAALLAVPAGAGLPPVGFVAGARSSAAGSAWGGAGTAIALVGAAYFLEGAGYIVTGTFIVAIVGALPGLGGLGPQVWILVGLAAAPSAALWTLAATKTRPIAVLVLAYLAQALGIALPALSDRAWAAAASAVLFGGTFVAIAALTLGFAQRAVPPAQATRVIGWLTAAFGLGQVAGPLAAAALAGEGGDLRPSLLVAAAAVLLGGLLVAAAGTVARSRPAP